ncbi:hypothetical protein HHL25_02945 [Rhizobium sp. S-51]|uniref:Uncharacterized protein n=1 Tax=Rhizobium terricola TaxID=2728849 RepID=A0A7Y0AT98_9HYPH|nr:hypothetical protein [Rhizobium terricola]NML73076.1 hypothetical protein [Rhizobium terricola]
MKTAIEHLEHASKVKFSEARQERARATQLQKQVDEATARAAFLESEARSLLAGADKLEERG